MNLLDNKKFYVDTVDYTQINLKGLAVETPNSFETGQR